jgi:ATP-dependent helicase HrpB
MNQRVQLPIEDVLPEVVRALDDVGSVVIEAPTGAGKSTRVPPAIADDVELTGKVLVVQPRRVAARAVARRIAQERRVPLGDEVGYQVRFDRKAGKNTEILVVTDGILLRMLQDDPFLEGIGAICFDEFHERRLNTDLALALARRVQREVRDDLKLVVMSATLDTGPIAEWLDAPKVISEGRTYPVDIQYAGKPHNRSLSSAIVDALHEHLDEVDGDALVFLSGVREIREASGAIRSSFGDEVEVLELYGSLPPDKQDRIFDTSDRRRIIVSTNVAETSVTIPNVSLVVDSGLAKVMRLDPSTGFDRLREEPISMAEADQRAGRAGRTSAGRAVRLWNQHTNRQRDDFPAPEIRRVDLADALLELFAWGETDPLTFPWFEAPTESGAEQALTLLRSIGLIDEHGITATGKLARKLALPPRLAAFLIFATASGELEEAALSAALLSERDIFLRSFGDQVGNTGSESDIADRMRAIREGKWSQHVHHGAKTAVKRLHRKLSRDMKNLLQDHELPSVERQGLGYAFAAAFPDRIAQFREKGERRAVTSEGKGLYLHESSSINASPLFVALDVIDTQQGFTESLCVRAVGIDVADIPSRNIQEELVYEFVEEADRVEVREERRCGAIILESENSDERDQARVSAILIDAAMENIDHALGLEQKDKRRFLDRWTFAAEHSDESVVPELTDEFWRRVLEGMALQASSFHDLRKQSLEEHLYAVAGWNTRGHIDRLAPERLEVPSGNHIRLDYSDPKAPVLPVKIQEMFGATETPRIAGGRVPVVVHLLAPNQRPQQVTRDLASFWENTYPEVRKELRQRYAKHPWPEDPLTAPATAKTKKAFKRSRNG